MNASQIRRIIKSHNLKVTVKARTNGLVSAVAFDVDDLNFLNYLLKEKGHEFKAEFFGTKFERYPLKRVEA